MMLLGVELAGRPVLVVGGGPVAARRVRTLLAAGAQIKLVSPHLEPALAEQVHAASAPNLTWLARKVRESDLDGQWLVLACADSVVGAEVAAWAEERQIWCVNASVASAGSALLPAQSQLGELTVAVASTGAADPRRSQTVLAQLLVALPNLQLDLRRHRSGAGQVTLVGAGPGAADLITVRGLSALAAADVVVHDRLGTAELLDLIGTQPELISVGKQPDHHPVPQSEINELLLRLAQSGKNVVRLKGGDPFLYGRGGEEVNFLRAHGCAVAVVPGLTTAIAVPTLAGIPVTHREVSNEVLITAGYQGLTSLAVAAVSAGATLVVLMGVRELPEIADRLLSQGVAANLPAAAIERGGTPSERVLRTDLQNLVTAANEFGLKNPAILIFGAVVNAIKAEDR